MTLPTPLIGILGGMGPQAGLDMAEKLISMTHAQSDQEHLPFLLFSLPGSVPDRTSFLLGRSKDNPAYAIADQFEKMSDMGVSIAVMACNTAHASPIFDVALDLLQRRGVKLQILHLIQETVAFIRETYPNISRVGILGTKGTYQTRLYDQALEDSELQAIVPHPHVREHDIHAALYDPDFGIKTNPSAVSAEASARILSAIDHLVTLGAEAIILGCTELPLAIRENSINGIPILDPATIMAEKLIRETFPERLAPSE